MTSFATYAAYHKEIDKQNLYEALVGDKNRVPSWALATSVSTLSINLIEAC